MKPISINKRLFKVIPGNNNLKSSDSFNEESKFNFPDFIVPKPMTQHEVEPPSYIWDRIAQALDEQESVRNVTEETSVNLPIHSTGVNYRKTGWFAAVVMFVGVVLLSVR